MRSMESRLRLRALVSAIEPLDTTEANHQADTLAWIDSDAELYRRRKPAEPPKHLVSYFVLVDVHSDAVFLVDHRNARLWLPTGGHVEPDEDPFETVRRELHEELGITAEPLDGIASNPLLVTQTTTVGQGAGHIDVSLWYVLSGWTTMPLVPDATEFEAVRWWTFDEIATSSPERFDPHFPRFISKLRRDGCLSAAECVPE